MTLDNERFTVFNVTYKIRNYIYKNAWILAYLCVKPDCPMLMLFLRKPYIYYNPNHAKYGRNSHLRVGLCEHNYKVVRQS